MAWSILDLQMRRLQALQPSTTESTPVCTKIRTQTCSHRRPPSTPSPTLGITSRSTSIPYQNNSRKQQLSIDIPSWRSRSSTSDSTILRRPRRSSVTMYPMVLLKEVWSLAARNSDPLSLFNRLNKAILPKSSTTIIRICNKIASLVTTISRALFSQTRLPTLAADTSRSTRRQRLRDICHNNKQLPKPRTISSFI